MIDYTVNNLDKFVSIFDEADDSNYSRFVTTDLSKEIPTEFSHFGAPGYYRPIISQENDIKSDYNWAQSVLQPDGDFISEEYAMPDEQINEPTNNSKGEIDLSLPSLKDASYDVNTAISEIKKLTKYKLNSAGKVVGSKPSNSSAKECARHVRLAFLKCGINITEGKAAGRAKDYVNILKNSKHWKQIDPSEVQAGDVCAINYGVYGHLALYDGKQWISDFIQNSADVYGNKAKNRTYYFRYIG